LPVHASEKMLSRGEKMRSIRFIPSLLLTLILFALATMAMPCPSFAQFDLPITIAPPPLPVYEQPLIPGPGYIWTPGYWAWSPIGYYWVPGTWVPAPEVGVLWTPGYWSGVGNGFIWNPGYWGRHVGYYGGVNYGLGYPGTGYEGGYWNDGAFFYNRAVNNITNVTYITNVYYKTVINKVTITRVSYVGGKGGIASQPWTPAERAAALERHTPPTAQQTRQQRAASNNRALLASVNHGQPPIAATSKAGLFSGRGVVAAKAVAPYRPVAPAVANRTASTAEASPAAQERVATSRAVQERTAPSRTALQQSGARVAQQRAAASRAAQQAAANRVAAANRLAQQRAAANRAAQERTAAASRAAQMHTAHVAAERHALAVAPHPAPMAHPAPMPHPAPPQRQAQREHKPGPM
jgi:hypothetical protein